MAQDDYFYEIQLTNKQLVFYFLAGATGLILSFLAGVMVGRGVDSATVEAQAGKPVRADERVVPEDAAKPSPAASASISPAEDLNYAQRLESDKPEETLDKPKPAPTPAKSAKPVKEPAAKDNARDKSARDASAKDAAAKDKAAKDATPAEGAKVADAQAPAASTEAAPASPAAAPPTTAAAKPVKPAAGAFTIQVGAFKDKATAESVVGRLKSKGYAAYVVSPDGADGLYNVRVGSYTARADAERISSKLKDEEKFKPFIVKP